MIADIHVAKTIDAPSDLVWTAIKNIDGLDRWFPIIESCSVEGEGVGAVRVLGLVNGGVMKDRILEICDTERRLRYRRFESPFPVDDYLGTVEVRDAPDRRSNLSWSVRAEYSPDRAQELSTFLENAFEADDFSAVIEKALADGVDGLDRELRSVEAT